MSLGEKCPQFRHLVRHIQTAAKKSSKPFLPLTHHVKLVAPSFRSIFISSYLNEYIYSLKYSSICSWETMDLHDIANIVYVYVESVHLVRVLTCISMIQNKDKVQGHI